jgi:hypothetical protein
VNIYGTGPVSNATVTVNPPSGGGGGGSGGDPPIPPGPAGYPTLEGTATIADTSSGQQALILADRCEVYGPVIEVQTLGGVVTGGPFVFECDETKISVAELQYSACLQRDKSFRTATLFGCESDRDLFENDIFIPAISHVCDKSSPYFGLHYWDMKVAVVVINKVGTVGSGSFTTVPVLLNCY